jgi:TolB protein
MRKTSRAALLAALFALFTWHAHADPINVDITRQAGKYNLGMAAFTPDDKGTPSGYVAESRDVIDSDLNFCRLFNLVRQGPSISNRAEAVQWGKLGVDAVLTGTVKYRADRFEIRGKIYDTVAGKELLSFTKSGTPAEMRRVSHEAANEVVKYFTGQPAFFNSKIVFVNDNTGRKELYTADYDGKNTKRLTNDNAIVILPRISPDAKKVIFTSYRSGNPDLYIINTDGSDRRKLSAKSGLNVSPAWSPGNDQLAITLSVDGPPNIYLMESYFYFLPERKSGLVHH